jgi:hypothetical protein
MEPLIVHLVQSIVILIDNTLDLFGLFEGQLSKIYRDKEDERFTVIFYVAAVTASEAFVSYCRSTCFMRFGKKEFWINYHWCDILLIC